MLNIKLPLWYQVARSIRAEIVSRTPGDLRLPTERDLAARYDVSLMTVRQALKSIEDDGLIKRHRRRGTFVVPEAIPSRSVELLGSVDDVLAQPSNEATDVLERAVVPTPDDLVEQFGAGSKVVMFRRVRYDGGEPSSYAVNYVREDLGQQITGDQLRGATMPNLLRGLGVKIHCVQDTVEARLADQTVADLLHVATGEPILYFTGSILGEGRRCVNVIRVSYRGDRYRFAVGFEVD